jgi:hypothetical protein
MRSVVDDLRRDTVRRVLALSVPERVALALSLGDAAVEQFARATGASPEEARRTLAARRHHDRTPSRAANPAR